MTTDRLAADLEAERDRVSLLTRKGIGMPMAGMLYWVAYAIVVRSFPQETALIISFCLTGAVFPVGVLLTRLAGGDLFAKSPSLTSLGLLMAGIQLFYWPIIVVIFNVAPNWTPFTMAVLFGSHFLPYGWLYRSRGYSFLAISVALVLTVAVLATGKSHYTTAPIAAAACYAIAIGLLWQEVRALASRA
jgi:formate/nitrite transporter FocA (FNT family)